MRDSFFFSGFNQSQIPSHMFKQKPAAMNCPNKKCEQDTCIKHQVLEAFFDFPFSDRFLGVAFQKQRVS